MPPLYIGLLSVAPFTGAWIEIIDGHTKTLQEMVAPFTGAWIEIAWNRDQWADGMVAPFTGAWIEIGISSTRNPLNIASRPSRARGLKFPSRAQGSWYK